MAGDWTPGHWFAVNRGTDDEPMMSVMAERISGQGPTHEVAIVATGDSPQEMENANAHLIAAAPALVEALEALVEAGWRTQDAPDDPGELDAARAALRKARGQQP